VSAPESMPLRRKGLALFAGGSLVIVTIVVWTVAAWPRQTLSAFLPAMLGSAAAMLATAPLLLVPKVRLQRDFTPRWYVARLYLLGATWLALIILLASALAAWMVGSTAAPILFEAILIVIVTSALLSIWSSIGWMVHALIRDPTPEPPPASH